MSTQESENKNIAQSSFELVKTLKTAQSSGFKFWALLFPVGFLYAHNQDEYGKKVALAILIPTLVLSIAFYFMPLELYAIADFVLLIWAIYVAFLVSTRVPHLVSEGSHYSFGRGFGAHILYVLIYSFIYYI